MSRKKNQPKQPYLETLEHDAKFRYLEKIREIDGIDPYSIPKADWTTNLEEFPPVSWPDLVMYLVFGRNEFTHSIWMNSEPTKASKLTTNLCAVGSEIYP